MGDGDWAVAVSIFRRLLPFVYHDLRYTQQFFWGDLGAPYVSYQVEQSTAQLRYFEEVVDGRVVYPYVFKAADPVRAPR